MASFAECRGHSQLSRTMWFYQGFIPDYAHLAAPLTIRRKETGACQWTSTKNTAFQSLKDALCASAELACPDLSAPFHVHFDASGHALGATISQDDETGCRELVTCISRKLTSAE